MAAKVVDFQIRRLRRNREALDRSLDGFRGNMQVFRLRREWLKTVRRTGSVN